MRGWAINTVAALAAVAVAAGAAAAQSDADKKTETSVSASLSAMDELAIISDYRRRLAREVDEAPALSESDGLATLPVLAADPVDASADAFVGDYSCSVYGLIDDYLGTPGVFLYRSGTFSCVIQRSGDGLRLRKTSGRPLDLSLNAEGPGLFSFLSDYDSGRIMPVRRWFVEMVDPDTVRILPFEPVMPGELADNARRLSGAGVTFIVLTRR